MVFDGEMILVMEFTMKNDSFSQKEVVVCGY